MPPKLLQANVLNQSRPQHYLPLEVVKSQVSINTALVRLRDSDLFSVPTPADPERDVSAATTANRKYARRTLLENAVNRTETRASFHRLGYIVRKAMADTTHMGH